MGQFEQLSSCLDQARSDSPMKRWKDDVMFDDVLSPVMSCYPLLNVHSLRAGKSPSKDR